jgi:hypothetical protein
MISHQDKLYLINLKLDFWRDRLQESNDAKTMLKELNNQLKIDSNLSDITKYTNIIMSLEEQLEALTNQG